MEYFKKEVLVVKDFRLNLIFSNLRSFALYPESWVILAFHFCLVIEKTWYNTIEAIFFELRFKKFGLNKDSNNKRKPLVICWVLRPKDKA